MSTKTYLTSLAIVMLFPLLALADWASAMFENTSHNFGMVARGADTRFSFVFTNKYREDVVIESVRSTCRCTQPSFTKQVIKTYETGQIDIQLDTRNFTGQKNATITVRFSQPFPAEIQLHSFCLIRSDVYVEPGIVAFGTVQQGQARTQSFRVNYAGQTYWQTWEIKDIQSESAFYKATITPRQRDYTNVSYDIMLTLKENAPEGYLHDFVDIVSNDPNPGSRHCPVPVSGYVIPSVTIKPSPLAFGIVDKNQSVTKTVVLSGPQPFSITGFIPDTNQVTAKITNEQKTVHIIPVTIAHNGTGGNITGTLGFKVSTQDKPVQLAYSADFQKAAVITRLPRETTPVLKSDVQTADDIPENEATQTQTEQKPLVQKQNAQETVTEEPAKPLTPAQKYFPPKKDEDDEESVEEASVKENEATPVPEEKKEEPPVPAEDAELPPIPPQ